MWFEIVILASTIFLLFYLLDGRKELKNVPPGPRPFPVIGNVPQLALRSRQRPYDMFHGLAKIYGPILYLKIGPLYEVVLEDYNTIKEVFCSDIWVDRYFDEFLSLRSFGKELGVLVVSGGNGWKEMRRFSIRTLRDFGFGKQKNMEETLEEELNDLTQSISLEISKGNPIINMKQYFTISVLNILWNMIAGYRFSRDDAKLHNLLKLLDRLIKASVVGSSRMSALIAFPIVGRLVNIFTKHNELRLDLFRSMHEFFRNILKERRLEGYYKGDPRDFIDVFLQEIDAHSKDKSESNYYTDEQFIVVCMDLFMAGSETTSNTMEFAILYMILHPEVQRRVQAEIDSVIGQNRFPSISDRLKMPYTEATLLEIQRVANVVPIIIRSPNQETSLGGYRIPKNTIGIINLYSMHMSEKDWEDPKVFNPNRFLNSEGQVINAHKILPFGTGKRSCLGEVLARASLFTFFTTFLQKYTFEASPKHEMPEMEPVLGFTLSPKPYHALVKPRS